MALPAAKYPAALYDGNEQTQPVLPPGGTDIANADDYNQNSTEIVAVETDLRAANVNGGKPNHADVHNDQEARIAALEAGGGAASTHKHIASRWHGPVAERTNSKLTTKDLIDVIPIEIPEIGNYDAMGFTAISARGSVKFAVYDSDDGGLPKTKLVDLGSIVVSAPITILSITAFQLTAGFRWLAMIVDDLFSVHTINRTGSGDVWESLIGRSSLTQFFQSGFTISGGTFAAGFPSDITTLGLPLETDEMAHVNIRKA